MGHKTLQRSEKKRKRTKEQRRRGRYTLKVEAAKVKEINGLLQSRYSDNYNRRC